MRLLQANKWESKFNVELSLKEIQMIFDAVGSMNWNDFKDNWEQIYDLPISDIPYNMDDNDYLYETLEEILNDLGGVTLG